MLDWKAATAMGLSYSLTLQPYGVSYSVRLLLTYLLGRRSPFWIGT